MQLEKERESRGRATAVNIILIKGRQKSKKHGCIGNRKETFSGLIWTLKKKIMIKGKHKSAMGRKTLEWRC